MQLIEIPDLTGREDILVDGSTHLIQPPQMWFETDGSSRELDCDCTKALIFIGIGDGNCPTNANLASFCFGKATLACFGQGQDIELPDSVSGLSDRSDLEVKIWQRLHQVSDENPGVLPGEYIGFVLRNFAPRLNGTISNWGVSNFHQHWLNGGHIMNGFPVSSLRDRTKQVGSRCFANLPKDLKVGINKVASNLPRILLEVNAKAVQFERHP